jgi:hypothetical protein
MSLEDKLTQLANLSTEIQNKLSAISAVPDTSGVEAQISNLNSAITDVQSKLETVVDSLITAQTAIAKLIGVE